MSSTRSAKTDACYCPRSFATPEALKRKAEIFQQRLCTSHVSCSLLYPAGGVESSSGLSDALGIVVGQNAVAGAQLRSSAQVRRTDA
jgi:hypothetical protein